MAKSAGVFAHSGLGLSLLDVELVSGICAALKVSVCRAARAITRVRACAGRETTAVILGWEPFKYDATAVSRVTGIMDSIVKSNPGGRFLSDSLSKHVLQVSLQGSQTLKRIWDSSGQGI